MMTDEQRSRAARLHAAIAASAPTASGVPHEVRAAALALKDEVRCAGTTARVLVAALGIHESTLCRWQQREAGALDGRTARFERGRRASFRVVHVVAADTEPARVVATASSPPTRGLRVMHAPSGLVVDGLDVDTLAALLRRMS